MFTPPNPFTLNLQPPVVHLNQIENKVYEDDDINVWIRAGNSYQKNYILYYKRYCDRMKWPLLQYGLGN